jgi:DNA-binding transcriptional ArsR family regulator
MRGRSQPYRPDPATTERKSRLLGCLAHAERIEILCVLAEAEYPVDIVAEHVGLTPLAVSQHLKLLRLENIVEARRDAQGIYYTCRDPNILRFLDQLSDLTG